jgi:hypothetical protein
MAALEKRALRYHRKGHELIDKDEVLFNKALDETGTVSTASLIGSDEESMGTQFTAAEATYLEREVIGGIIDGLLNMHGIVSGSKPEGVTRLACENPDGFNTQISDNETLDKAKEINDELEANIVAHLEHKINSAHKENINGMGQMFNGGEAEIRSLCGHNVHVNIGQTQQGGTAMLLHGSLIDQYDFEESGKDDTGLGRWVVMVFHGVEGIKMRVVCGYNTCIARPTARCSTYQQHRQYFITQESYLMCPRK